VLAALVASGMAAPRWSFEGFLPRRGRERRDRLSRIAADERASILYEAPSRVPATLADLVATAGGERRAAICRELTKIHEEVVRGPLADLAARAAAGEVMLRGEFVIVIEGLTAVASARAHAAAAGAPTMADARAEVARLIASGLKRSESVRQVAVATGLDRRELYR
jgi:16S rRNA (cytidine1402-2'-O)-methyltransferase